MSDNRRIVIRTVLAIALLFTILSGCADTHTQGPQNNPDGLKAVEPAGEIPETFRSIIENNAFKNVSAFDGRLLKAETLSQDKGNHTLNQQVRMMDIFGNDLAVYSCDTNDAYHITTLTATEDGGFLFVLGFEDYAVSQDVWASDSGYASRIIKCDKNGALQFDIPFDNVEDSALAYCFEKNGAFYLFGTVQTPQTRTRGVYSSTDIYAAILDQNGSIMQTGSIAGSDFDALKSAERLADGFVLSIRSQSDDGDFAGSDSKGYPADWIITLNDALEIVEKKTGSGRDYFDFRLGEVGGTPVYTTSSLLSGFDAGMPTAVIDYGDYYLVVSENNTGVYEKTPPFISSIWYYTETVYSAYSKTGQLLFRAGVDSSPDYDALVE